MGISACMAREGSFTHVRRVLRPRVGISACMVTGGGVLLMLGASSGQGFFFKYRLMGISACKAREGSFTHVRRVLRPRVGISACMVTEGGVLLMLDASTGQGLFWGRLFLGYLHAWPGKGVLLMLGAELRPRE